jgi:dehydrogenase/reductase SDR family member 7B
MNFLNKIVWITGASSGIGEHLAYSCIKRGATVILSARNKEKLEKVKTHCTELGGKCYIYPFDLADSKQIEIVAEEVLQQYKNIDVLINNGGVSQRSLAIETLPEVDRKIMETNYFGTIALTRKVLPVMIKNGGGNIAVTASITGLFGFKLRSSYSASKHALHGYFESLRMELYGKNIHITIVSPGRIRTNLSLSALSKEGAMHGKMDDGQKGGISAEKCSEKYIKAIEKNKKEVLIGNKELIMVYLKRFAPFLFHRIIVKVKAT